MIHISFEIRSGSTVVQTIDFGTDGRFILDGYFPKTSDDGLKVTDSVTIFVIGTSNNDVETKIRDIESALYFSSLHPSGPDGVWVLFSPSNCNIDPWQSRLSGGALILDEKLSLRWLEKKAKANIVFIRDPFWETEEAVTLLLTNRGTTEGESSNIVNHQDSGATDDLYVEIDADQVTGVLQTPAIIEYKNTINDSVLVDHLTIGHFAASGTNEPPAAGSLIFEGVGTSNSSCSGGAYAALSWADALENQLINWSLSSGAFRQKNYKVIARLKAAVAYSDLWLQAKLLMGTTVITETRWVLVNAGQELITIGSIQIPPFRFGTHIDLGNLTLALYEKKASGAGVLDLDYIATIPQDSWRRFGAITGLAYNETLIDDPVNDTLVTSYSSSHKITHKIDEGNPIMLQPGVKNVLYFLHDTTTGASTIARTGNVVVKIHPRRLTV